MMLHPQDHPEKADPLVGARITLPTNA